MVMHSSMVHIQEIQIPLLIFTRYIREAHQNEILASFPLQFFAKNIFNLKFGPSRNAICKSLY